MSVALVDQKTGNTITCRSHTFVPNVVRAGVQGCRNCIRRPKAVFGFGDRVQTHTSTRLQHDIPDWLQPFMEGMTEEGAKPSRSDQQRHPEPLPSQPALQARPSNRLGGKHSLLSHFTKDPNCDTCKRTKITRAPCSENPES